MLKTFLAGTVGVFATMFPLVLPVAAQAQVTLVGTGQIPGSAKDRSGLSGTLKAADGSTTQADQLGSFGSALVYSGSGHRYYAANDRGFGDGTTRSLNRLQVFDITVDPAAHTVKAELEETKLLTDEAGESLVGLASEYDAAHPEKGRRFDPEGIAVARDGSIYLSDEYGPFLWQFDTSGRRIARVKVPEKFLIDHPDPGEDREIESNKKGRVTNKGMEGLTITPDKRALVGIMQSPLIQDGGRKGINNRILRVELEGGKTNEYVYRLDAPKLGVSEILAINDHRFLTLERDSKGGKEAKVKRLYEIDTEGASDVSAIGTTASDGLPAKDLPSGVTPVEKRLFLDLLDPKLGLAGDDFPAKVEGITWGPDLPDGRRLLLVISDNDMKADAPTMIFAFAVARDEPGLVPTSLKVPSKSLPVVGSRERVAR